MLWVLIRITSAEAILMSTHNIGFNEEIGKISLNYHQISSNTHPFSSSVFFSFQTLGSHWIKGLSHRFAHLLKLVVTRLKRSRKSSIFL